MNFSLALTTYPLEFFITVLIIITLLPVAGVILVLIAWRMSLIFSPTIFSKAVQGKHCLVTGGSQGLGKGIAIELVKAGAHVTIVARGKKDPITKTSSLEKACDDLKKIKVNPDQIINYYACDLTQYAKVVEMCEKLGNAGQHPEWVICNAGSSLSGFIADELPKLSSDNSYEKGDHEWMIEQNYFSAVNVVRAVFAVARSSASESSSASTNHGVDERISGFTKKEMAHLPSKIILVGSVMSTLSFIGYSAYSGSKYALRGFADALRSELKPLDIDVSLYFPGNMDTPGFEQENKGKPSITREIEGASTLATSTSAAQDLLASVMKKRYYISNDLLGELARVSVHGGAPRPNLLFEVLAAPLLAIVFSVWAFASDLDIKAHFRKN